MVLKSILVDTCVCLAVVSFIVGCSSSSSSDPASPDPALTEFDGTYNTTATSITQFDINGGACANSSGVTYIINSEISGSVISGWGDTYIVSGDVQSNGDVLGGFAFSGQLVASFEGAISGNTGSGTWKDINQCSGTWQSIEVSATPSSLIQGYAQFEEGDPGIESDGIYIDSSLLNFPDFSLTLDPKPVIGTNADGTTITVFTELSSNVEFAQLYFEFGYLGTSCLVLVDDNDAVVSLKTTGEATYYSAAVMTSLTDGVRQLITDGSATITNPSGCSSASVSNMFLNRIEFLKFSLNPVSVDAVSIDLGIVRR